MACLTEGVTDRVKFALLSLVKERNVEPIIRTHHIGLFSFIEPLILKDLKLMIYWTAKNYSISIIYFLDTIKSLDKSFYCYSTSLLMIMW